MRSIIAAALSVLASGIAVGQEVSLPTARLLTHSGLAAEHVALIMSDQQGGDLLFEQVASVIPLEDGTPAIGWWLEVDADNLLSGSIPERLFVKISTYVLEGQGNIVFAKSRVVEISNPAGLIAVDGVRVVGGIELPAGDYRLRTLVSEPISGRVGLRQNQVRVPSPREASISAFEVDQVAASWLEIPLDGLVPPTNFEPSALSVLPANQPWNVRMFVLGTNQILIENSHEKAEAALTTTGWTFAQGPGRWSIAESTITPDLAVEGRFEIAPVAVGENTTSGRDLVAGSLVAQGVDAELVRGGVVEVLLTSQIETATTWTRVKRNAEAEDLPAQVAAAPVSRKLALPKPEIRRRLLAVLTDWANGDPAAQSRLGELENDLIQGSGEALATLADLELRVFDSIGQREPGAVIPILALYLNRYTDHLREREYQLSTHCKRLALSLAQRYLGLDKSETGEETGDFFAAIGGMQASGGDPTGLESLRVALRSSPDHAQAMELLAWRLERSGDYRGVIALLENIEKPTREARIRRALVNLRLNRSELGISELKELSASDDWVAALAAQELLRFYIEGGIPEEASRYFLEFRKRFPENQGLAYLQAMFHDLQGRPQESLAEVTWIKARTGESERHRYSKDPQEKISEVRSLFEQRSEAYRSSLLKALQGLS